MQSEPTVGKVKDRFKANILEITNSLNFEPLIPLLCEGELFSFEDGHHLYDLPKDKAVGILCERLEKDSTSYSTFLDCVQRETTHLGHAFIAALLEGSDYSSESEIAYSKSLKSVGVKRFTDFTKYINLFELVPHMYASALLTEHERDYLRDTRCSTNEKITHLMKILNTKGPKGYVLFAKCLQNEHSHCAHDELYTMMHGEILGQKPCYRKRPQTLDCDLPLHKRMFRLLKLHGPFNGECKKLVNILMRYHHAGQWVEIEAEAKFYLKEGTPIQLQVVARLELAICLISQHEHKRVFDLVSEAKTLCKKLPGDNPTILEGRSEYVLSRVYRSLEQYEEAKEHAKNSIVILSNVEAGSDTAFAHYSYACALVESDDHPKFKDIEGHLNHAIDDVSRESGLDLDVITPCSFMKLSQMYISSTHDEISSTSEERNDKAEKCLKKIDEKSLALRSRCYYYLRKSELYHKKGMLSESKSDAQQALDLAVNHNFNHEVEVAANLLKKCSL